MKEPFINHMFPGLEIPREWEYKKRAKQISIYESSQKIWVDRDYYCDYCNRENCNEECEEALADKEENDLYCDKDQPKTIDLKLEKVSLQTLIDQIPEGLTPNDIKISLSYNDRGVMYSQKLSFYYIKTFPANRKGYNEAKKKYDEAEKLYFIEREKYDQWVKEQKKEKLLKELKELGE